MGHSSLSKLPACPCLLISCRLGENDSDFLGSADEIKLEKTQRVAASQVMRCLLRYHFFGSDQINGIELFAGGGGWVTETIMSDIQILVLIEIETEHVPKLQARCPDSLVLCGDSITDFEAHSELVGNAGVVALDNPSALFGNAGEYCEHFDVLTLVLSSESKTRKCVIFNVNIRPFNKSMHPGWQKRRASFYGPHDGWQLADFINFYVQLGRKFGKSVVEIFPIPRRGSFLYFFVCCLSREPRCDRRYYVDTTSKPIDKATGIWAESKVT